MPDKWGRPTFEDFMKLGLGVQQLQESAETSKLRQQQTEYYKENTRRTKMANDLDEAGLEYKRIAESIKAKMEAVAPHIQPTLATITQLQNPKHSNNPTLLNELQHRVSSIYNASPGDWKIDTNPETFDWENKTLSVVNGKTGERKTRPMWDAVSGTSVLQAYSTAPDKLAAAAHANYRDSVAMNKMSVLTAKPIINAKTGQTATPILLNDPTYTGETDPLGFSGDMATVVWVLDNGEKISDEEARRRGFTTAENAKEIAEAIDAQRKGRLTYEKISTELLKQGKVKAETAAAGRSNVASEVQKVQALANAMRNKDEVYLTAFELAAKVALKPEGKVNMFLGSVKELGLPLDPEDEETARLARTCGVKYDPKADKWVDEKEAQKQTAKQQNPTKQTFQINQDGSSAAGPGLGIPAEQDPTEVDLLKQAGLM